MLHEASILGEYFWVWLQGGAKQHFRWELAAPAEPIPISSIVEEEHE